MEDTCDAITVEESSGNVFADLGRPEAAERLAKAKIAFDIRCAIEDSGLSQKEVGERLGISQPDVSRLLKGQLARFSTDRLIRFLIALSRNVEIRISSPRPRDHDKPGTLSVVST